MTIFVHLLNWPCLSHYKPCMKLKHSWWGWTWIVFFEISISLVFIPHHLFNFIHQINHISYFVVFESCSNKWRLSTQNTLCIWCMLENNQKAWCSVWTANPCVKEICFVHFSWFSKHWNLQEVLRINKNSETTERFSYSFSSVFFVLVFGHLRTSVICTSYIILAFSLHFMHSFFLEYLSQEVVLHSVSQLSHWNLTLNGALQNTCSSLRTYLLKMWLCFCIDMTCPITLCLSTGKGCGGAGILIVALLKVLHLPVL